MQGHLGPSAVNITKAPAGGQPALSTDQLPPARMGCIVSYQRLRVAPTAAQSLDAPASTRPLAEPRAGRYLLNDLPAVWAHPDPTDKPGETLVQELLERTAV